LETLEQKQEPFFLAVGFFKPHLPFNAPKKYWDLYDRAAFSLQDRQTRVTGAPDIAYHTHRELAGYQDMSEDEQVSAEQACTWRHGYYACASYVDAQVGRVLDALQRLGLDQNTIVVLWGDHGWSLGEKDRWCKGTNFERDTLVPRFYESGDPHLPKKNGRRWAYSFLTAARFNLGWMMSCKDAATPVRADDEQP
jgi:iduronate 2-sulfatase